MIRLNICPIPKGRPRFNRYGHAYTPERTRDFEERLRWLFKANHVVPSSDKISLKILFVYKRDADLDNFIKSFCDAANQLLWEDDRDIVRIEASKRKALPGEEPYVEFERESID